MRERIELYAANRIDGDGNPAGGIVSGIGIRIEWQDGPLGRPPQKPTGAFVEDVIEAARQRLQFYQEASGGKYACGENFRAITKLTEALNWLASRRIEREARDVQGLHKP